LYFDVPLPSFGLVAGPKTLNFNIPLPSLGFVCVLLVCAPNYDVEGKLTTTSQALCFDLSLGDLDGGGKDRGSEGGGEDYREEFHGDFLRNTCSVLRVIK